MHGEVAENLVSERIIQTEWFLLRIGNFDKCLLIPLNQTAIVIGRSSNKHLKESPNISRKHVRFEKTSDDEWIIQDLQSTNGVFVNFKKIDTKSVYCVQESDIIGLGSASADSEKHFMFKLCRNKNCLSQNIKTKRRNSDYYLKNWKLKRNASNTSNKHAISTRNNAKIANMEEDESSFHKNDGKILQIIASIEKSLLINIPKQVNFSMKKYLNEASYEADHNIQDLTLNNSDKTNNFHENLISNRNMSVEINDKCKLNDVQESSILLHPRNKMECEQSSKIVGEISKEVTSKIVNEDILLFNSFDYNENVKNSGCVQSDETVTLSSYSNINEIKPKNMNSPDNVSNNLNKSGESAEEKKLLSSPFLEDAHDKMKRSSSGDSSNHFYPHIENNHQETQKCIIKDIQECSIRKFENQLPIENIEKDSYIKAACIAESEVIIDDKPPSQKLDNDCNLSSSERIKKTKGKIKKIEKELQLKKKQKKKKSNLYSTNKNASMKLSYPTAKTSTTKKAKARNDKTDKINIDLCIKRKLIEMQILKKKSNIVDTTSSIVSKSNKTNNEKPVKGISKEIISKFNSLQNYKIPKKIRPKTEAVDTKETEVKKHLKLESQQKFNDKTRKFNDKKPNFRNKNKKVLHTEVNKNFKRKSFSESPCKTKKGHFSKTENKTNGTVEFKYPRQRENIKETEKFITKETLEEVPEISMTTLEDVITKILQWNANWLLEQKDNLSPPPIVDQSSLRKVALFYNSKQEYFNTYINLLLLEIWNCMFRSWQITLEKKSKSTYFAVVDTKTCMDTMIINCQTVISPKIPFDKESYPFEGNIVVVDLRIQNVENAVIKVFGYISEHKQENYKPGNGTTVSSLLTMLPICKEENIQLISFVVKMKLRDKNLDLSKLMKIEMISYIKPLLRHCEALFNFTQSNLYHHILKPDCSICSCEENSDIDFTLQENYNATQILAISRICKSICQSQSLSKIHLLDGPPGTGKTYTVVGIIRQLLCQKDREQRVKLLVTAPSNIAVDEIGIQLLKMKSQLKKPDGKNVRFVRIGQGDQVHRDLKFYFIEELVKHNLKELQKDLDQINMNELQIKIARLKMEIQREKINNNSRHSIEVIESQLENYYQKFELYQNRNDINKCKQKLRMDILTKADIILSTLNGCRNTSLENAFGKNSSVTFTCCIVDEAAQCTEPEVLIPLQYGINKLILVGDPEQLPASVTSKIAIHYGLQLSLFERFQRYFVQAEEQNPILCLTENYRMHSEICSFVSENFLCNPLNSKVNNFSFPLKPYVLLDILSDHEFRTSNMSEVVFVGKLCKELLKILPSSSSVGLITFHQTHKHAFNQYFDSIDEWRNKNQYKVEVNVVDSFQGREKDVIILYCAGANNSSNVGYLNDKQRLKVAFTRVRYSLILCCDVAFLKKHFYWNGLLSHAKQRNVSFQVKSIADVIKKITK